MVGSGENSDSGPVPFFGSWRVIYVSVLVVNLMAMAMVYFFSRFPF